MYSLSLVLFLAVCHAPGLFVVLFFRGRFDQFHAGTPVIIHHPPPLQLVLNWSCITWADNSLPSWTQTHTLHSYSLFSAYLCLSRHRGSYVPVATWQTGCGRPANNEHLRETAYRLMVHRPASRPSGRPRSLSGQESTRAFVSVQMEKGMDGYVRSLQAQQVAEAGRLPSARVLDSSAGGQEPGTSAPWVDSRRKRLLLIGQIAQVQESKTGLLRGQTWVTMHMGPPPRR